MRKSQFSLSSLIIDKFVFMISYMCMNFWPGKDKLWWTNCLRPLPIRLFGVSLRGSLSSLNFYMRLYSTSPWCRSRQPQDDKILISKQTFHHFVRCSKYQTVRIKHEYYRLLSSVSFFCNQEHIHPACCLDLISF